MVRSQIGHIRLNRQDDTKQKLRIHRYYIAAGSSLLVIGLMFACALQGVPADRKIMEWTHPS